MNRVQQTQQTAKSYFRHKAMIALVVILLCLLSFLIATQVTSVVVTADEAMTARVKYCLDSETAEQGQEYLSRFFTDRFIQSGQLDELRARFENVAVNSYNAVTDIQWVWTWPWGFSASVKVVETVDRIAGEVTTSDGSVGTIPTWPSGTYSLKLKKQGGAWLIDDMQLVSAQATPTPSATPAVGATPQPTEEGGGGVQGGVEE